MKAWIALGLAVTAWASPAAARDLSVVLKTTGGNVLLIDRSSIGPDADDPRLRKALLSIDNSAIGHGSALFAADISMRADCAAGLVAIVWSRAYSPSGEQAANGAAPGPHDLARPDNLMERAALKAICEEP